MQRDSAMDTDDPPSSNPSTWQNTQSTNPSQADFDMIDDSPATSQDQSESNSQQDKDSSAKDADLDHTLMPPPRPRTPPRYGRDGPQDFMQSLNGGAMPDLNSREMSPEDRVDSATQRRYSLKRNASGERKLNTPSPKKRLVGDVNEASTDYAARHANTGQEASTENMIDIRHASHPTTPNTPRPRITTKGHGRTASELSTRLQNTLSYAMVKVQNGWENRALTPTEHAYALEQASKRYAPHDQGSMSPGAPSPKRRPMSAGDYYGGGVVDPLSASVLGSAGSERSPMSWSRPGTASTGLAQQFHGNGYVASDREIHHYPLYNNVSPSSPASRPLYPTSVSSQPQVRYPGPSASPTRHSTYPTSSHHHNESAAVPRTPENKPANGLYSHYRPHASQPAAHISPSRTHAQMWDEDIDAADTLLAMGNTPGKSKGGVEGSRSVAFRDDWKGGARSGRPKYGEYANADVARVDRLLDDIRAEDMA